MPGPSCLRRLLLASLLMTAAAPAVHATAAGAASLTPGSAAEEEAAFVGAIDALRYAQIVAELSGAVDFELDAATRRIATRWAPDEANPDGILLAREYLRDRLEAAGYAVELQEFSFSYGAGVRSAANLVAVHPGQSLSNEILVVGAHFDARAEQAGLPAPGAEDNASGVAAVLHLAEQLAGFESERTIHFVAFDAEEYGISGSEHYVAEAVAADLEIVGALTMDMISAWTTDFGVLIEGQLPWQELMFALRDNVDQWTTLARSLSYTSFGSDHVSFQNAGIPALLAIDLDWAEYADYHRSTDTFDKVDPALGTAITRALAGTIADIASIHRTVAVSGPPPGAVPTRTDLTLHANEPNPFNPATTLRFTLPEPGPTRLDILDLRGRRVRSLLDQWLDAGVHESFWDGRDDQGGAVASGVYLSRLSHAAGIRARSLTLVR